jgi:flagellar M-ring protein FliF
MDRSPQQRAFLAAALLSSILAIAGFIWVANRQPLAMLYGGLDPAQTGKIIEQIEARSSSYEIRGDAIWVAATDRDRLRVELAAEGLPDTGIAGYEILDGMSGFGTTSQMFDAAYWRAKEGELARTILAVPNVATARVHLAIAESRGYRREPKGRASVTLTTSGAGISAKQAAALKYLVASGVQGLTPDDVAIIDTQRGLIASAEDREGPDRAVEMKRNVERILEPHVGIGNAIVELNMDLVTETEQLTEQRYDPDQRALISQVTEETTDSSNMTGTGPVTAASNLPDAEDEPGERSESNSSQNRQQANYEVSRLTREVTRQPGSVKRLTVAVLLNGVPKASPSGETEIVPRTEAELEAMRQLVASAVGFDESRGDQITVKSLPFRNLDGEGTALGHNHWAGMDLNGLARLGLIGVFVLAVVLLLLRPFLRGRRLRREILDVSGQSGAIPVSLTPSIDLALPGETPAPAISDTSPARPPQLSLPPADPVARLRNMMRDRQAESVKILAGWIENRGAAK